MKISTKIMAMTTLFMSTLLVMNSENWFSMWLGLEINMMSFIPMIDKSKSYSSSESKMMYFLMQSMGSIMLIFVMIMNPMMMNSEMYIMEKTSLIITMAMMLKMGAAPMHMWFVTIMKKMNWNMCFILMTWQKLAPMYILSNMNNNNIMIMIVSTMSAIVGAIGGLNQTSIKTIMAFSSVNHMGWMIMCMKFDNEMWMKYWMIYTIMLIMMTYNFNKMSTQFINQMNMNYKTTSEKMNIIILFLSLGGLPPMIGFLPKWMVIQSLISSNCMIELFIMIMSTMITLFFYMRMISPIMMMQSNMNKWNFYKNKTKNMNIMMIIMNLMLPLNMVLNMM